MNEPAQTPCRTETTEASHTHVRTLSRRDLFGLQRRRQPHHPPQIPAARILAVATAAAAPLSAATQGGPLFFRSATEMAAMIRRKEVSATEVVQAHIDRIHKVNPMLNAVVMPCFERALEEAKAADAALAKGNPKGPLHGVPMTIKDSIETEGVISTGGTQGRSHHVPKKDATVVARLRAAGAILLGKTNTPEFTIGGVSGLGTTANILYGMTRNPYDPRHTVYGSSGGAGAIVAAGGAAFDIGSDFGGSIRSPCHHNGIVGIKATAGRVPRTGHAVDYGGIYDSQQQVGPMARRIEDLILITPLLAGPDFKDAAMIPAPFRSAADVDLKKLRVAFFSDVGGYHKPTVGTVKTVEAAAKALGEACGPVEESAPDGYGEIWSLYAKLRFVDSSRWIRRIAQRSGTLFPAAGRKFDEPMTPVPEVSALIEQRDDLKRRCLAWFQKYDVLICPTNSSPARLIGDEGHPGAGYTTIYNITGWPAVVVRCGAEGDLPIGLQVVARPFREDVAFAVAEHLESVFGGWKPPAI